MFSYRIVACLGIRIFIVGCLVVQLIRFVGLLFNIGDYMQLSPSDAIMSGYAELMSLPLGMTVSAFPLVFVFAGYLIVSSIVLIKKEGRSLANCLGLHTGAFLVAASLLCIFSYDLLGKIINTHSYLGYHISIAVEDIVGMVLWYLGSLMLATIYVAKKSAKHMPKKPVDYVIVLGCRVLDDGMPGGMLRKRVDAALRLCRTQRMAFGSEPILIMSGGQGSDESISEAESMRRYAKSRHFAGKIIMEDESRTTRQNFLFSKKKMKPGKTAAFATTDFHVFRSGIIAAKQGIGDIECVAAKSPWYYYANYILREFAANINSERKIHLLNIALIVVIILLLLTISYLFNIM